MPARYEIDRPNLCVLSRAWGSLTDADLLEHQRRLTADRGFDPTLNQLFDFRAVERAEVTGAGIRALGGRNPFGDGSRRAFVIEPGATAVFGLMRMFELLTSEHLDELRVQFNHVEAARRWLGLRETEAGG